MFIERDDQVVRIFSRERELIGRLEEFGFESVRTESLSVDDEIAVLSQADIVIGLSGAGFANVLYCREGAVVVELTPDFLVDSLWVRNICAIRRCHWIQILIPTRPPAKVRMTENAARPEIGVEYDPDFDIGQLIERLRPIFRTRAS